MSNHFTAEEQLSSMQLDWQKLSNEKILLKSQRDEMLSALKEMVRTCKVSQASARGGCKLQADGFKAFDAARAAIAKAESN